jgi:hypothetical protein
MSRFMRGSAVWWEVMRGECSDHFRSGWHGATQAGRGARSASS